MNEALIMATAELSKKMSVRKDDCSGGNIDAEGQFSHPVFKKLALLNGKVDKMNKDELKDKLAELGLDTRGLKDVLKKRLKNYYKRKQLTMAKVATPKCLYDYFIVIDFEATCERNVSNYPHEIIEFPAVLIDAQDTCLVDEFHSYVKPVLNPHLTEFCTELTGITQSEVDKSPMFPEVLKKMEEWMASHKLGQEKTFAIVTDGPWDMSRFMYMQCKTSDIPYPNWAKKWVNIRKAYCNIFQVKKASLVAMLEGYGLAFEGHQHSGIADTHNIARILTNMLGDNCCLRINERITGHHLDTVHGTQVSAHISPVLRDELSSGSDAETTGSPVVPDADSAVESGGTGTARNGDLTENGAKSQRDANGVKAPNVGIDVDECADLLEYFALRCS